MPANRHPARRALCFALCLAALSTTTGCVYWRLFKIRRQLAAFDTHCTITQDPGAIIRFNTPVLKPTDVEWLLHLPAERDGAVWKYRLHKRLAQGAAPDTLSVVEVSFLVENDLVREVTFPPQFNSVLNHDTLSRVFVGAAEADVEKSTHQTGWQLDNELEIPRMDRVQVMLGVPTRREDTEIHYVLMYEYDLKPGDQPITDPDVSAVLVFGKEDQKIVHAVMQVGALGIFVYRNPNGPYRVNLQHGNS